MEKLIEWTKELSIGIDEIDNQHKYFIKLINKTNELARTKNKDSVREILDELLEYARVHFSTEEKYFKKWDYPYANEHIIEHEKLILKALKFSQRFDKEGVKIVPDFIGFLIDWLENHLKKHDFKYRDFAREKNLLTK